jgi:hypothetical protein
MQLRPILPLRATLSAVCAKLSLIVDITADSIELVLRDCFQQRLRIKSKLRYEKPEAVKASTVRQELRVLRYLLNVAVRKKLPRINPCSAMASP